MTELRAAIQLSPTDFDLDSKEEIEVGSYARIYTIMYRGKKVVVKLPLMPSTSDEEIKHLSGIAHRNIVIFYGILRYSNRDCVVMEYASRGSVRHILEHKDPKMLTLLRSSRKEWICDVARAINYLHTEAPTRIGHTDLKSSNVLIFDAPYDKGRTVAKVSDFGQARELIRTSSIRDLGSQLWSAPEILNWAHQSLKSDVWSFGATVVEFYSEEQPYFHKHEGVETKILDVLQQVENSELNPLTDLKIKFPRGLRGLLRHCFKVDHTERPSMKEVLNNLENDTATRQLRLSVFEPNGDKEEVTVDLQAECNIKAVFASANRRLTRVRISADSSVCFVEEQEYADQRCRGIQCFDPKANKSINVDEENGLEMKSASSSVILRFLNDHSALPDCPNFADYVPQIFIENKTVLLHVEKRELKAAQKNALLVAEYVAFLCGIKCDTQYFWKIRGTGPKFLTPEGEVITGEENVITGRKRDRFIVFLRNKDRVPFARLPEKDHLVMYHRLGSEVKFERGQLTLTQAPFPNDGERWVTTSKASDVDNEISKAAKKSDCCYL